MMRYTPKWKYVSLIQRRHMTFRAQPEASYWTGNALLGKSQELVSRYGISCQGRAVARYGWPWQQRPGTASLRCRFEPSTGYSRNPGCVRSEAEDSRKRRSNLWQVAVGQAFRQSLRWEMTADRDSPATGKTRVTVAVASARGEEQPDSGYRRSVAEIQERDRGNDQRWRAAGRPSKVSPATALSQGQARAAQRARVPGPAMDLARWSQQLAWPCLWSPDSDSERSPATRRRVL